MNYTHKTRPRCRTRKKAALTESMNLCGPETIVSFFRENLCEIDRPGQEVCVSAMQSLKEGERTRGKRQK